WAGDVGQGDREEVDLIERGKNYGWRIMEGSICNPAFGSCDTTGLTRPVKDYGRNLGSTVIGGYIYRGYRQPNLRGAYIYGDFGSGRIWMLRYENGVVTADSELISTQHLISSFGLDQDNELYICSYSTSNIYRFSGNPNPNGVGETAPGVFRLEQNYPNPYNPITTIRFSVPVRGQVELKVYTALGEEVSTLVNAEIGPGTYSTEWNAGSVASGVYFYRLKAGVFSETRKLLLLK
ncbi:MAG: protein up-regulated by thyroid hormone-putative PQQ-dependent glucose dehydrogenase, partial [Bacteroidetes bacterium]|nr:protein up-regulated by thyroid hormone-putative PQQ-dependent glucose dehydrogenase [Bacteroidota bacterium]